MPSGLRIYLASSWRNPYQPTVLAALRNHGHEVYDFRNPAPGNTGFGWQQCDEPPQDEAGKMRPEDWRRVLDHERAREGYKLDSEAMAWANTGVLLLPAGNSGHLELGWLIGSGRRSFVLVPEGVERVVPELMHLLALKGPGVPRSARTIIALSTRELLAMLYDFAREPVRSPCGHDHVPGTSCIPYASGVAR